MPLQIEQIWHKSTASFVQLGRDFPDEMLTLNVVFYSPRLDGSSTPSRPSEETNGVSLVTPQEPEFNSKVRQDKNSPYKFQLRGMPVKNSPFKVL